MALAVGLACGTNRTRVLPTVLFASGADLQSINPLVTVHPLAKQVQKHVLFLTLASYDERFEPQPRLATWEWNTNRTALTFHVRSDVYWHDGVQTTAADVAWTLNAAREPAVAYPRARDLSQIESVTAPQLDEVVVRFARRQPVFPDVLTDLAILPRHVFDGVAPEDIRVHPFNRQPIGNGPYEFQEYLPNQRWVFRKSADFPSDLGPPAIDRFVVVVVDESTTKLAALTSGELDFAGINPAHATFVRDDPDLDVVDYPVQFAVGLIWNLRRAPFANAALRRALTAGLDRDLLIQAFVYGFGAVADGPVSPGHRWTEDIKTVPFDPDRAAGVLDSLGWRMGPDGVRARGDQRLSFELLAVNSGDNALEQMVQAQWRTLGVEVRIRLLELASFLDVAQSSGRDFDALVIGVPGDLALGHVAALYASGEGPLAYAGYTNSEFDRALFAAQTAETAEDLEQGWRAAQRVLAADHPTTWLYHARGVQGIRRRIRGVSFDLRGELATLSDWTIEEERP